MGDRLKDKVAVVTGAGGGIGRGEALALAEEGAKVVVNDLGTERDGSGASSSPADGVVAEIKERGGVAVANHDDVSKVEGGENIIKTAVDNFGKIDILVNNAGILRDRMVFNMTAEEWDAVIKVHLYGTFNCTKPAAAFMRQQRSGRIINTSSTSGLLGNAGQANYGAAKAGIAGFTWVCARDLGRYGITVNCIVPGATTRMTASPEMEAARQARMARAGAPAPAPAPRPQAPAGGGQDPEDVAPMVVFLCTDAAAGINGYCFGASGSTVSLYANPAVAKSIHKVGRWTQDELASIVPRSLFAGLVNPAPPEPPKQ